MGKKMRNWYFALLAGLLRLQPDSSVERPCTGQTDTVIYTVVGICAELIACTMLWCVSLSTVDGDARVQHSVDAGGR
jgi:hypothetical protein